jgi:hypothetical protein
LSNDHLKRVDFSPLLVESFGLLGDYVSESSKGFFDISHALKYARAQIGSKSTRAFLIKSKERMSVTSSPRTVGLQAAVLALQWL